MDTLQKDTEERFKALYDASFGGIVIHDKGVILECNDILEEMSGYMREELIGMNGTLLFAEESRQTILENIHNGYTKPYNAIGVHKSGKHFYVHVQGKDIFYRGKKVRAVEVRDITEQMQIETALRESEDRFRALHEASSGGICIHDKGFILECNDGLGRMFGYKREELIGMNGLLLIAENSRSLVKEKIKSYFEESYEAYGVHKNGHTFPIRIEARNVPFKGKNVRTVEFRDLTKRKQAERALRESEAMFRSLAESSPDVIARFNRDCRCLYINMAVKKMFLLEPDAVITTTLFEPVFPNDISHEWSTMASFVFEHGTMTRKEMLLDERWLDVIVVPEYSQEDNSSNVIITSRDITEKKRLEAERDLIDKMESLSAVAGGIAHDFNNLLFGVLGNIGFAIREEDEETRQGYLSVAYEATRKASSLAHQLLTFAKGGVVTKKVYSIKPLLKDAAIFVLGKGSQYTYEITCDDTLPKVYIDTSLLSRVLHNLIINAKQAMKKSGVVKITASCVTNPVVAEGTFIQVSIQDTGAGIHKNHLEKIFTPFFTTKKAEGGSGLGLSVCYSIMHQHDGFITVESTFGEGAIFHLFLPIVHGDEQTTEEVAYKKERSVKRMRVLVLDDEQMLRDMLSKMLEALGHTAVVSSDGQEAVDLYRESFEKGNVFDLVILDLTIPGGMNGVEALKHLITLDPNVHAILSTGYTDKKPEGGFVQVLHKPYTLKDLAKALEEIF